MYCKVCQGKSENVLMRRKATQWDCYRLVSDVGPSGLQSLSYLLVSLKPREQECWPITMTKVAQVRIVGSYPCQRTDKHHRQGVSRANKLDILRKSEKNSQRERVILRDSLGWRPSMDEMYVDGHQGNLHWDWSLSALHAKSVSALCVTI